MHYSFIFGQTKELIFNLLEAYFLDQKMLQTFLTKKYILLFVLLLFILAQIAMDHMKDYLKSNTHIFVSSDGEMKIYLDHDRMIMEAFMLMLKPNSKPIPMLVEIHKNDSKDEQLIFKAAKREDLQVPLSFKGEEDAWKLYSFDFSKEDNTILSHDFQVVFGQKEYSFAGYEQK